MRTHCIKIFICNLVFSTSKMSKNKKYKRDILIFHKSLEIFVNRIKILTIH